MIDDYKSPLEHDNPLAPIYTQGIFAGDLYQTEEQDIERIEHASNPSSDKSSDSQDNKQDENQKHLEQRQYEMHESYNTPFTTQLPIIGLGAPEADQSVDSANTRMVRARTRDKRCLTGTTIKDANFFKKFYGNEFDEAEKRWWYGQDDY